MFLSMIAMIPRLLTTSSEIGTLSDMWTQFMTWVTSLLSTITGHPILLLGVAIFAVGGTIGLVYRLIRG